MRDCGLPVAAGLVGSFAPSESEFEEDLAGLSS